MRNIDPAEAEQLVVSAMNKDPARRSGVRTIHSKIVFETGTHLTRYVLLYNLPTVADCYLLPVTLCLKLCTLMITTALHSVNPQQRRSTGSPSTHLDPTSVGLVMVTINFTRSAFRFGPLLTVQLRFGWMHGLSQAIGWGMSLRISSYA